jgi:hypothetical protein
VALELVVRILGDASGLSKELDGASGKLGGFGGSALKTAAIVGGVATVAAGAALAIADMTTAAAEDAQEQDKLTQAIANATGSTIDYTATVDAAIAAGQDRAFTDSDVRAGLESLVTATGSVDQATQELAIAQDIARAAGVDLETASDAVAKAHAGQDGALRKLLPGLQKGAKATDTIANAQRLAAGQADKYADSIVGQQARAKDSFSELGETIGAAFLPALEAILPVVIQLIKWLGVVITAVLPPLTRAITVAVSAFSRMISVLSRVVAWVQSLVSWVQRAIDWLGRIKVPDIKLPFGIGGHAAAPPGGSAAVLGPLGTAPLAGPTGGASGGVTINVYGDPAVVQAAVIRALRQYGRRNGLALPIGRPA